MRSESPHATGRKALLSGGGTGGHVYPTLALAQELEERGWTLIYAGRPGSFESRLAAQAGLEFFPLAARPLVGRGTVGKLHALVRLAGSALRAWRMVRRRGVDLVVGTGSYVAAPAVLGGRWAGRPVVLLEPNVRAGVANRWLSRFARAAITFLAPDGAGLRCPTLRLGVPVRREFERAHGPLPVTPRPRLLVVGGSQGARQLNELAPAAIERLARSTPGLRVVHQCGAGNLEEARRRWRQTSVWGTDRLDLEVTEYIHEMADELAQAQLVVSRAGALTLAEICVVGRPAVLLPLAAAQAHQMENARALEAAGGAVVLESQRADADTLGALLVELLSDRARMERMAQASSALGRPGAAAAIAQRMESLVRGRP